LLALTTKLSKVYVEFSGTIFPGRLLLADLVRTLGKRD